MPAARFDYTFVDRRHAADAAAWLAGARHELGEPVAGEEDEAELIERRASTKMYGPFSRELRTELGAMHSDGFLDLVPQSAPYGPTLRVTGAAQRQLVRRWPRTMDRYEPHLDFVAEELGGLGVGMLERPATALWVTRRARTPTSPPARSGCTSSSRRSTWRRPRTPYGASTR